MALTSEARDISQHVEERVRTLISSREIHNQLGYPVVDDGDGDAMHGAELSAFIWAGGPMRRHPSDDPAARLDR